MKNPVFPQAPIARACVIIAVGSVSALTGVTNADIAIDTFSDVDNPSPWPVVQDSIGSTSNTETGLSGVLGGVRNSTIAADAISLFGVDNVTVNIIKSANIFDYASSAGAEGSVNLNYAGSQANPLSVDLSAESQFALEFLLFDHANNDDMPVTITLADAEADSVALTRTLTAPGAQTVGFSFVEFTGDPDFDFTDVREIDVFFNAGLGTDFRLSAFDANPGVPAPASLMVFSFAAVCRRRRRSI